MSRTILLYGATGFSGRLIAAEAARNEATTGGAPRNYRMILAGRDGERLKKLADDHRMDYRVFGLDNRNDVRRGLDKVSVIVNAAGPFAWTAERLAKVALEMGNDYADINGEGDVYRKLDDLGVSAEHLGCTLVCGAGHSAGASDLLLDTALRTLLANGTLASGDILGSVRIAMSRVESFSRGSAQTAWRSLREQVTVVRGVDVPDGQHGTRVDLVLWHEPVGKLERTFDFREYGESSDRLEVKPDLKIASAADLVDTLTARLTIPRNGLSVRRIESYVQAGTVGRIGYQLGALLAPVAAIPGVGFLARTQMGFLPPGPTIEELAKERHALLLQIEDAFSTRVVDWRLDCPNVYQLTAQIIVAVAAQLAANRDNPHGRVTGWRTPAEILGPLSLPLMGRCDALRGCRLDNRSA